MLIIQQVQVFVFYMIIQQYIFHDLILPYMFLGMIARMAMASEVQSQMSKHNAVAIGGNLAVNGNAGGGAASVVFRHQMSSVSSIEFMGSMGLRALLGVQTTR